MKIKRRLLLLLIFFSLEPNHIASQTIVDEKNKVELLAKSDSLFAVGVDLYNAEKYEEAIPVFTESDKIDKAVLDSTSNRRDYSAMWLSSCYYQLGDSVKANETHKYYNYPPVDRRLTVKSDSLSAEGLIAYKNGDLERALSYFTQCAEIEKSVVGEEHIWYLITLSAIDVLYFNLARKYSDLGNYSEAIKLVAKELDICEKLYGKEHPDYAISLNNLALYNSYLGNYTEAIRLGTEALNIREKVYGKEHPDYAQSLNNLASYNSDLGNYQEAIRLCTEAMNIFEKIYGREHPDYATSLNNLASYTSDLGNYQEAIRLCTEALNICEKVYGKEHPDYATSLNNLALYNSYLGNYTEAIRLGTEALNIRENVYGKEHPAYATSLSNLASYNSYLSNYSEAIRLDTEALSIREKLFGKNHPDYATSLNNLANYNSYLGNYSEAVRLATEAHNIYGKVYGTEHTDYATSLNNLANYYFYSGDIESTNHYSLQYAKLASALVKKIFAGLTSSQRQQFWEKYRAWYEKYAHRFSYILPSDTLTMNGYNGALLSKGLLLNSEIEFSKLIQESDDSEALAMYEDLKRTRTQVNKLREEYSSIDSIKLHYLRAIVDSLSRESDKMEKELVSRSKVYGDYTKNLVITWEQVQKKLGEKDIAVEFVSFPLNADSTMYVAYVLRNDWEHPKMIPLFEEKQLLAVQKGDRYTTDAISRLVWKPLDEVMQGVKKVYFAPSGELYNIAIESIPSHEDGGETLVGEHRDFYRLSSTRELALIKDESRWDEAAVYGGLQYGMSVEGMIEEDGKYEKAAGQKRGDSTPSYYVVREDSIGRGDRDLAQGLAYLEGTKKEAEAITHDLEQKAVDARLFTDSIGTETSFKALGGKKTSIIHIGTHGFFNDKKKENKDDRLQLLGMDYQPRVIEDDALTRSGLYFAGADNVRLNGPSAVPDSIDDGRLTAAEITQLDLRGLDMVVLSACQTGLGEITGDGVFGLQRGFKKAGAQTIVMSLWKVDDDATTEFMTTFFENMKIEDGRPANKYQAFKTAQEELRKNKDKYSDKNCWAAFVMLDGVD